MFLRRHRGRYPGCPPPRWESHGRRQIGGRPGRRAGHRPRTEVPPRLACHPSGQGESNVDRTHLRARLRRRGDRLWRRVDRLDHGQADRQRPDARDRRRDPGRRAGLPQSPVPDDRHRRPAAVRRHLGGARRRDGGRIRRRRHPLRPRRLHRDERVGALERAHGRGGSHRVERGARGRVPRRCDHRHARGRPRPPRRRRILLVPAGLGARRAEPDAGRPAPRDPAAGRPRLRRLADLDLRASWRRHLHQGRRRGRRSRRQGRSRHSGRRPAQPGCDRRQRRRQRRRLRRHGRRSVRDLRRDDRRDDAAGRAADAGEGRGRRHVSAGAGRLLDPGVDRRLLFRQGPRRRQDHERPLSRPDGRRRDFRHRILVHHQPDDGRCRDGLSGSHDAAPVRGVADRPCPDGGDGRHHRVLHGDRIQAGAPHRRGVHDGARDQHHRRHRRVDEGHRVAGDRRVHRDLGVVLARRPLRHRNRGDVDAVDGGHHRRARRLRPDHRQRRRHRRDGETAGFRACDHRSAGRRGQHDQGSDQGLRDRLRGARCTGALRRLHARAPLGGHRRFLRPVEPQGHRRAVHRRAHSLSVRRDGDGGGRPRRRRGGDRGAPAVQGDQRHHGRHGQARVRRGRRHADQGGDQGNDRPVAAAGAGAGGRSVSRSGRRRWVAC